MLYEVITFGPGLEADIVIRFLENRNGERDSSKPFSIFWAPNPPHNPYFSLDDCEQDIYERYYRDMSAEELIYRRNIRPRLASEPERRNNFV